MVFYTLDSSSPTINSGDYVCLMAGSTNDLLITKATPAALAAAGSALGLVTQTYTPGATNVNVSIGGTAPNSVTGLGPGPAGEAYLDSTGRVTRVQTNFRAGYCDTTGKQIIAPTASPLIQINVLDSPFNFDNTGTSLNDSKLNDLLVYLGTVGRARIYFPAGDYRFAGDIGPWPGGTIIEGDGYSGTLVPNTTPGYSTPDPGYPGNSAYRVPNAVSGTRILCEGDYGFRLGHLIGSPSSSAQGRACTILRNMEVLGRQTGGASPQCITNAVLSGSTVTITTNSAHGYHVGDKVIVRRVPGNPAANTRGYANTAYGTENSYYLARTISRVGEFDFDIPQAVGLSGPIAGGTYGPPMALTTCNVRVVRGQTWVDCTSAVNVLPYGGRVIIRGTGTSLDGNEWHIQPMAGYPHSFIICQSGGGGTTSVSATGTYTGPGTVMYGGHCLKVSRCNEVGVEFLSEQAIMHDVRVGRFHYLASIDGALVSWMQRMAFDGVSFDATAAGYDDIDTEMGVDGASSVRVGSFNFPVRNATNANFIDCCQFNGSRNAINAAEGIGLFISNTNHETGGARCILQGMQTLSWDNSEGEGCQSASFLLISPYDVAHGEDAPVSQNIMLRNWWPDATAPLFWAYDSTARAGAISLHNVTFADFCTVPYAPIMAGTTSDLAQIEYYGCTLPAGGTYTGALTNIEIDLPTDRKGNVIAQTTAAKGALDIRPMVQDGTPGLVLRQGPRIFSQLGLSNGYPNGSVGGTGAKSDGWKNRIFSPETAVTGVQDRDAAFWLKLASSAAATKVAQLPIATTEVDFFLGNITIVAHIIVFHNGDKTKMARWRLRRSFHYDPNTFPNALTPLGPSVVEDFEDTTGGGFTTPTIDEDNSTSSFPTTFPSISVTLKGYAGDPSYWGVYYSGLWNGV